MELETYGLDRKVYKHESATIVATEKMMMKNSSETVIEKKYLKQGLDGTGHIFSIKTLSETYGKDSATQKLSRDMNSLISQINVSTNTSGKLRHILNKYDVIDKWAVLKKKWKKEATKEDREQVLKTIETVESNLTNGSFEGDITNQGALYFLLNGLYGSYDEKKAVLVKRDLNKFLVTQPLPLNITYEIVDYKPYTKEMTIEGTGEVDEERLDKKTLTHLIRSLKDKINLKVDLQVNYKERFEFDTYHWLTSAQQDIKVKIPGFYMTESKQKIAQEENYEQ